jgi:peroxiredoxin
VTAVLAACTACSPAAQPAASATSAPGSAPKTKNSPPDFELDRLDGGTVRLSEHLGKDVVLIDFWATFCEPCLASMPQLDAIYRKYKGRGFVVLGVSIDGPDSVAQVRAEVQKLGVSFPILLDQETRAVALYNPKTSAPFSVLIGRDGSILKQKEGYTTGDAAALEQDVAAAVGK